MRVTLNLEGDLYAMAKSLARELNCSIGAAVTELMRRALRPAKPAKTKAVSRSNGLPVVQGRQVFSSEDVYRIESEAA